MVRISQEAGTILVFASLLIFMLSFADLLINGFRIVNGNTLPIPSYLPISLFGGFVSMIFWLYYVDDHRFDK